MDLNYNLFFANTTQLNSPISSLSSPLLFPTKFFTVLPCTCKSWKTAKDLTVNVYREFRSSSLLFPLLLSVVPQAAATLAAPNSNLYLFSRGAALLLRLRSPAPRCGNCPQRISEVSVEVTCVLLFSQALSSLKSS